MSLSYWQMYEVCPISILWHLWTLKRLITVYLGLLQTIHCLENQAVCPDEQLCCVNPSGTSRGPHCCPGDRDCNYFVECGSQSLQSVAGSIPSVFHSFIGIIYGAVKNTGSQVLTPLPKVLTCEVLDESQEPAFWRVPSHSNSTQK